MVIRIAKMRVEKMLLGTSKEDKLNFTCIKGIRFMFLYKCTVALTMH